MTSSTTSTTPSPEVAAERAAFEVELKFPLPPGPGSDSAVGTLESFGAAFGPPVTQADTYYAHPVRDFAATDEAVRVRVVTGPDDVPRGRLTYKGPKLDAATKTREEYEPRLVDGPEPVAALKAALERLGFAEVLTVTKTRRTARLTVADADGTPRVFEVARDEVPPVGRFLEIETAATADTLDAGRAALLAFARTLELGEPTRRSYLSMVLESAGTPSGGG